METVFKDRKQLRRLFTIACNSFDKAENQLSCVDKINKLKLIEEKALLMMACEEKFKQLLYSENTSDTEIEREVDESETYIDRWRSLKQKLESFVIEQLSSKNESFNIVTNTLLNYPKIKLPTFDDSFTLFPRPLSPASAVFLDKTELKRIPKISENENGVKSVAKKSFSVKYSGCPSAPKIKVTRSTRSFFGEESLYIMDAKSKGNIGRYLNHSCSPNVFVQNVFVNTHDLRFPEVAFFAQSFIQAGTELTWDYNYEVGSVSGKVMYCYCDSRLCRGRLL
ncbi:histone-lysine N-methyltransferase SETDB1 [Nephila pilipes]|uniref:Histone-lysine N-methyltransferase SETDB1 n=1 Tax=Nephila pilipes TaxID=299642 RepID=A0A8X6PD74_NEPPI|nr:histone-lysine N-methyltransferase SETDB1 [Nephila pilipes]